MKHTLAYMLRHSRLPDEDGGWVKTSDLCERGFTMQQLLESVANDTKNRFELADGGKLIRARYGHSTMVDLHYEPCNPPMTLYHGTAEKYLDSIRQEGIKPQNRIYVHLYTEIDGARSVGARHGKAVVLKVAAAQMANDGFLFYRATDKIWLTLCVPIEYVSIENDCSVP